MPSVSFGMVMMFLGGVAGQLVGLSLMPMTKGLTAPLPTLGCAVAFLIGLGLLTRVISGGAPLSMVVPLNAVAVPLGALAISIVLLGEAPSLARIVTLIVACILIGVASIL